MNDRTENCGGNRQEQANQLRTVHSRPQTDPVRTVRAADLFGNAREVLIEHEKAVYRLRITRQGKLILNK